MIPITRLFPDLTQAQAAFLQSFFLECPKAFGSCLMLKAYPKNHTLINTNDSCAHVYILLSGRLQAIEERVACEPYRFTEISAIEIVGDYELFTKLPGRMITLTTLEESLFLIIPAADYLTWIKNDANALFIRTQMLIRQLINEAQFDRQNFFLDNKARLLHFILSECKRQSSFPAVIPLTRTEIASKLGCSARTVNRMITALQREGGIDLFHGKIQITQEQYTRLRELMCQSPS